MSEFEYYWEKAEFQDPEAHRAHVENYKKGIRDSICGYSEMDTTYDTEAEVLPPSMFVEIERGGTYRIVYQKENKVMYAVSSSGYNAGNFTLLVDENGDPMLYEGE